MTYATLSALALVCLLVGVGPAAAQVYETLTPKQIEEAIALGKGKDERHMEASSLDENLGWGSSRGTSLGYYSTPFLRVAAAARLAHRNYKPYTAADVDPALLAPELHVYAFATMNGPAALAVTQVVITPRKGKEDAKRAKAIFPSRFEPLPMEYKNLFGATFQGEGKIAVFPLSTLDDDHEVHIVYEGATDRRASLRLTSPSRKVVVH